MPIAIRCPHCGEEMSAPDTAVGMRLRCRSCQQPFIAQAPGAPTPPPAPAPARAQPPSRPQANRPEPPRGLWKAVPVLLLTATIVLCLNLVLSFFTMMGASRSPQWEYRRVVIREAGFDDEMNRHGHDGWELASARRASDGIGVFSYEVIMKRRR